MSSNNSSKVGPDPPNNNPIRRRPRRPLPPPRVRRMFPIGSLSVLMFLIAFFMKLLCPVGAEVADVEKVKQFLKKYNTDEDQFTYLQLKQWFDNQMYSLNLSITPDLYPRLFPFCVTYEQVTNLTHLTKEGSKLYFYKNIFKRIKDYHNPNEKFFHFDDKKHTIAKNHTFVKSVTFTRINTPEPDMINLRQWVHITVKTSLLKGIYLQPIVGPAGLPVGEFSLEFPCSDDQTSQDIENVGELVYCHYRPKSSAYHPKIYIAYSAKARKTFHVHYKWADITCLEAPYLQFLMIAVKEFKRFPIHGEDYQIIYSDVFLNTGLDSQDGSPYPYHPIWKHKMLCQADGPEYVQERVPDYKKLKKENADYEFAKILWENATEKGIIRVQPNEEYDACITGSTRKDILKKKDDTRLECPPGPFRCTESNKEKSSLAIKEEREAMTEVEKNITYCYPCAAPGCFESGFTRRSCIGDDGDLILVNDTSLIENLERIARTKSHGTLASLATLVLIPLANHLGRFYKEACNRCLCGNGPWIFLHIIFHGLGSVVLWISIGPVVAAISNYEEVLKECRALHKQDSDAVSCATERSLGNPHVPLGVLVFLFQNLMIVFGFLRSSSNAIRGIQVAIHSIFGHITFIMAGVAAIVAVINNRCLEIVFLMGTLLSIPILFLVISIILECMSDKKIGISPARKQFPVLEPIKLEKRGPMECLKWFVFGILTVILLVAWCLVVLSSNYSAKVNNPDAFNPDDPAATLATTFQGKQSRMRGLFSKACGSIAEDYSDESTNSSKK